MQKTVGQKSRPVFADFGEIRRNRRKSAAIFIRRLPEWFLVPEEKSMIFLLNSSSWWRFQFVCVAFAAPQLGFQLLFVDFGRRQKSGKPVWLILILILISIDFNLNSIQPYFNFNWILYFFLLELNFWMKRYDVVIASNCWNSLDNALLERSLLAICNLLKPDGIAALRQDLGIVILILVVIILMIP